MSWQVRTLEGPRTCRLPTISSEIAAGNEWSIFPGVDTGRPLRQFQPEKKPMTKQLAHVPHRAYGGGMGKLRVVTRSSTLSRVHGTNVPAHGPSVGERPRAVPENADESVVETYLGQSDLAESGTELRRLLEAVRPSAPSDVTARLEGAIIVLDALAAGKHPSADELLVPGPYSI